MSGLFYTAPFRDVALPTNSASPLDIFELIWPSGVALTIHEICLSSQYNVDERVDVALLTRTGAGSTAGGSVTPNAVAPRNTVASAITSFKYVLAIPGTGGTLIGKPKQWSQLADLDFIDTPEMRIELPATGGRLVLNNSNFFVAATRQISGWVTWEER